MPRPQCPPEEDILRAITTPDWDDGENRIQHGFFRNRGKGDGISVSRLAVLSREAIIEIFRKELTTPVRMVRGLVEINVGELQGIGRAYDPPVELTVEEDPTPTNPAHALVPQPITRGLSGKIREYLEERGLIQRW
jgi:hypothetical protein